MKLRMLFFSLVLLAMGGSLFSPSAKSQSVVVGASCSASGQNAIANTGQPVVCTQNSGGSLVWTGVASGSSSSPASFTPACASSMTFTMSSGPSFITDFFLNLNCNVTTSTMGGTLVTGMEAVFTIQNAGSNTFAWPTSFLNTPIVSSGTTVATFQYCGTVGSGTACPANSWQNTDVSPVTTSSASTTIDAAVYGVVGNGKNVNDANWLNASNIVNSATANWTSADVGKDFIGADTCLLGVAAPATSQSRFSVGTTITAVNSATQITVSTSSSAAVASGGCVTWGKNQDTGLSATDTAAQNSATCPVVVLPQGIIMMKAAHFVTNPVVCARNNPGTTSGQPAGNGMKITGQGKGVTILVPMPGFSGASCSSGCFGSVTGVDLENFSINGFGQVNTMDLGSNWFIITTLARISNISLNGYSSGIANGGGVKIAGSGYYSEMSDTDIDAFGGLAQLDVVFAILIVRHVAISDGYGNNGQIIVDGTGGTTQLVSTGDFIGCANTMNTLGYIKVINGGTYYSGNGDFWHTCGGALTGQKMLNIADSTSSAFLSGYNNFSTNGLNSTGIFNAGTLVINTDDLIVGGSGTGFAIDNASTGVIVDNGKWRCCGDGTTNARNQVGGVWSGSNSLQGSCTGVATASSTIGLYGLGQLAALTCTSTTVNLGQVMNKSGTLAGVTVTATAAGVPGSGVVTVLKNGVATTITCTIGTGTSCVDFTHATAYVTGDVISVQFTTQAADTLAGVKASVVKN